MNFSSNHNNQFKEVTQKILKFNLNFYEKFPIKKKLLTQKKTPQNIAIPTNPSQKKHVKNYLQ